MQKRSLEKTQTVTQVIKDLVGFKSPKAVLCFQVPASHLIPCARNTDSTTDRCSGGFSVSKMGGEGHQPLTLGSNPIIWQDLCQKLHENKRNWTESGARVPSAPIGSAKGLHTKKESI